MVTFKQREDFERRCVVLRERLCDSDFLENKGLGNEAGIFTFCYDPGLELEARDYFKRLKVDAELGKLGTDSVKAHVIERNLYDVFLGLTERKRVLEKLPIQEEKRGKDGLLKQIKRIATPEVFVATMDWQPHQVGDVLLITGVGEIYPFMRAHNILNHMHSVMRDVPVVLAYPGTYDGGSLCLFGKLKDGNYYRAFDLI